MNRICIFLLAGAALIPLPAMAQESGTAGTPFVVTMTDDQTVDELDTRSPDIEAGPENDGDGIAPTALSAVASSSDSQVTLTLSGKPSTVGRSGVFYPSLTLSAPINDGEDDGGFLTQDGWPNKFSAKVSFSFVVIDTSLSLDIAPEEMIRLSRRYREVCLAEFPKSWEYKRVADASARQELLKATCDDGTGLLGRDKKKLRQYLGADFEPLARLVDELIAKKDLWLINLAGTIGHRKYAYLDPTNFSEGSVNRTPFSLSISAGYQSARDAPFFGLGYEYEESDKAGKQRVVCLPVAVGAPSNCKYEIFDAPTPERSQTAFGFVRFGHLFSGRDDYGMFKPGPVLEIRVGYDFENDRLSVKAPLYFLIDKDGGFKGGIRFEWEQNSGKNGEDEGRFSLFVTKSFGFLDI
jgi:hypothetical protein